MIKKLKPFTIKEAFIDGSYRNYKKVVNMSFFEYKKWVRDLKSMRVIYSGRLIRHNLELLRTPKHRWNMKHVRWSNKSIKFINHFKNIKAGNPISKHCHYSKKTILLKNMGYDPNKR